MLTETGSHRDACRAVRLSETSARALRRDHPAFADACDRALGRAAGLLEQAAFERAVAGWDEPIVHAGRIVGQRRRYSDALLRELLRLEAARAAGRAAREAARADAAGKRVASPEETDKVILSRLKKVSEGLKRRERQQQLAWAETMRARGLAP